MKKNNNMIKHISALLISLLMILSMVACSNDSEDVLRIGMELKWPPFETTDENGKATGISVMIAEELGEYLDREVEIVDLPFGSLIPALESDKIDVIIASMSITEERKEKINFSDPYMYFKILSVVNNESGIETYEDIFSKANLRFVAPKSFASLDIARKKANNPSIMEFDDKATASFELASGNADIFMVDAVSAVSIQRKYADSLTVIYEPVEVSPIGMGVRKTDTELLEKLNTFISQTESLGVNDRIRENYDDTLMEMVGKGYGFYLNED